MEVITETLIKRLIDKGIGNSIIPALLRDVINIIGNNQEQDVKKLSERIQSLGWNDFELDEYTFQLIIANIESHAFDICNNRIYQQALMISD